VAVERCDDIYNGHVVDHVVRFSRPSPSIFGYFMWSRSGGVKDLGTRLCAS